MARKHSRRSYGSGSIQQRGKGLVIRWREKEIASDGSMCTVHRCGALGSVSRSEAAAILRHRLSRGHSTKIQTYDFCGICGSMEGANFAEVPEAFHTKTSR